MSAPKQHTSRDWLVHAQAVMSYLREQFADIYRQYHSPHQGWSSQTPIAHFNQLVAAQANLTPIIAALQKTMHQGNGKRLLQTLVHTYPAVMQGNPSEAVSQLVRYESAVGESVQRVLSLNHSTHVLSASRHRLFPSAQTKHDTSPNGTYLVAPSVSFHQPT